MDLTIHIPGQPIPQGSLKVLWKTHKVISDNPNLAAWRRSVTVYARAEMARRPATGPMDGPLAVVLVFVLRKPPSAPKARNWPTTKPDLDKLIRAVLDALTDARVWTDDARVVTIRAHKAYAKSDQNPYAVARIFNVKVEPETGR